MNSKELTKEIKRLQKGLKEGEYVYVDKKFDIKIISKPPNHSYYNKKNSLFVDDVKKFIQALKGDKYKKEDLDTFEYFPSKSKPESNEEVVENEFSLSDLPSEIDEEIIMKMPIKDIVKLRRISKRHREAVDKLWCKLYKRDFKKDIKDDIKGDCMEKYKKKYEEIHSGTFNIVLLGDQCVGKTTWVERWVTGDFIKNCKPGKEILVTTIKRTYKGIKNSKVKQITAYGGKIQEITFNIHDCPSIIKEEPNKKFSSIDTDAAIIMFDVTNIESFKNVNYWIKLLEDNWKVPYIVCGNKIDELDRKVKLNMIKKKDFYKTNIYFDISAKSMYHEEQPLRALVRKLFKDDYIIDVPTPIFIDNQESDEE